MKLVYSLLTAAIVALASINVVGATSLRAGVPPEQVDIADDALQQRRLQPLQWPPPYWRAYKDKFPEANFAKCTKFLEEKGIVDPVDGTRCHKRVLIGNYSCVVGLQTCDSDLVSTSTTHPTKICKCDIGTKMLTCSDWNPCGDNVVTPPAVEGAGETNTPRPIFTKPSYWGKYLRTFPEKNFQPCVFLERRGITDPQDEDKCHMRAGGDYTCAIGTQTCPSDLVATTEHPAKTCMCNVTTGKLTDCEDWNPCQVEQTINQMPPVVDSPPVPDNSVEETAPVQGAPAPPTEACPEEMGATCDPAINNQECPVGTKMCSAGCYTDELVARGPEFTCSCDASGNWMCWGTGCGAFACPPQITECPLVPPEIGAFCDMTDICSYGTSQCGCGEDKLKMFQCGEDGLIEEAEPEFLEYCWGVCPEDDPEFPHDIEGSMCTEAGGFGEDCTCNCGDVPCGPKYMCECTEGTYSCTKRFNFRRTLSCACELPEMDANGDPVYARDPNAQCPEVAPTVDDDCDGLEGERCGYDEVCTTSTSTYTCSKGKWLERESWVPVCHEPITSCPADAADKPEVGMPCDFVEVCSYGHACGCGDNKPVSYMCAGGEIAETSPEVTTLLICDTCPEDDPDFPWDIEGEACTIGGGVGIDCHCNCNNPCGPEYFCECSPDGTYECEKQGSDLYACVCAAPPTDENGELLNQPDPNAVCPETEPTPGTNCSGLYGQRCGYSEVCGVHTRTYDCNQWNGEWNNLRNWIPQCPETAP